MWFVKSASGVVLLTVNYLIIAFADITVTLLVGWPWEGWIRYLVISAYQVVVSLAIASHLACVLIDPGALPAAGEVFWTSSGEEMASLKVEICKKCGTPKPPRVHHCSTCNRCIIKLDHHCPWVNNCVGMYNQKHFVLYLLYINTMCTLVFLIIGARVANCACTDPRIRLSLARFIPGPYKCDVDSWFIVCSLLTTVLGIVFWVFTVLLLFDQVSSIITNTTGIEVLKSKRGPDRACYMSFYEAFGGPISWKWLLPLPLARCHTADRLLLVEDSANISTILGLESTCHDLEQTEDDDHASSAPPLKQQKLSSEPAGLGAEPRKKERPWTNSSSAFRALGAETLPQTSIARTSGAAEPHSNRFLSPVSVSNSLSYRAGVQLPAVSCSSEEALSGSLPPTSAAAADSFSSPITHSTPSRELSLANSTLPAATKATPQQSRSHSHSEVRPLSTMSHCAEQLDGGSSYHFPTLPKTTMENFLPFVHLPSPQQTRDLPDRCPPPSPRVAAYYPPTRQQQS